MRKLSKLSILVGIIAAFAFTGCQQPREDTTLNNNRNLNENRGAAFQADTAQTGMNMNATKAVAVVHSTDGNISGWVTFTKASDGVRVHAELKGLSEGEHGFHVHQYGDCRADDFSSAGGHYNPDNEKHGAPTDSIRHMGDMGNISTDGTATMDYVDHVINIDQIIGRAIIVHKGEDDLTSQPSGDAGPRVACGVIGLANEDFDNNNM
ncbi:MAG TPA: superoxide dismutase family protein [Balneolaceae bacterium]|nr:superoxide dismutase family protein [Balneolaceae bacterium]